MDFFASFTCFSLFFHNARERALRSSKPLAPGSGGYSTAVTQVVEVENELNIQVTFSCPPPGAGWEVQMLEALIGNVAGGVDTKSGDPKSIQITH